MSLIIEKSEGNLVIQKKRKGPIKGGGRGKTKHHSPRGTSALTKEEIEKKMRGKTKMWLENYETYFENRNENDISIKHLNQIIYMHGFTKLYNIPKNLIADAVGTFNLLVPFRSTLELKDTVSSCAFLTTEEVMEDLSNLEWQECSVQSVETVSSGEGKDALIHDQSTERASSTAREITGKDNTRKKRKVKSANTGTKAIVIASTSSSSILSRGSC